MSLAAVTTAMPLLPAQSPEASSSTPRNLRVVGALALGGFNADVWGHRNFAYVGSFGVPGTNPASGIRIIDLGKPDAPRLVTAVARYPGTTAEDPMVARIHTRWFQGDLLAVGIQAREASVTTQAGLDLWDVTDPHQPAHLAFLGTGQSLTGSGPHEIHVLARGDRAYVLIGDFRAEFEAVTLGNYTRGQDFKIVDVTDPRHPVLAGQWSAYVRLGIHPRQGQGAARSSTCHSVSANTAGTVAYLAYMDAGMIMLDITDPTNPTFLGRSPNPLVADGNTHSAIAVPGTQLVITTDEDMSPLSSCAPNCGFPGWGFARILDVSNATTPVQIGMFATPNSLLNPTLPVAGVYTVHNPMVRGRHAYFSWYSDGVRVVDISQPAAPREVAVFLPPAHPDPFGFFNTVIGQPVDYPFVNVWGVWVGKNHVLVSDTNYGLYVLDAVP